MICWYNHNQNIHTNNNDDHTLYYNNNVDLKDDKQKV